MIIGARKGLGTGVYPEPDINSPKASKSGSGFTLVEVLIVVIIIGILASLALPLYRKSIEHARVAEAIQILSNIRKAEAAYRLRYDTYTDVIDNLAVDVPADDTTLFNYSITAAADDSFTVQAARNTNKGGTAGEPTVTLDGTGTLTETW